MAYDYDNINLIAKTVSLNPKGKWAHTPFILVSYIKALQSDDAETVYVYENRTNMTISQESVGLDS